MENPPPKTPVPPPPIGDVPPPNGEDMAIDSAVRDDRIQHFDTPATLHPVASRKTETKLVALGIATALVIMLGGVFLFSMTETHDPALEQQIVTLPQDEVITDYKLFYASGGGLIQYNPLNNESAAATANASPTLDHPTGDYAVTAGESAIRIVSEATGETLVQFSDPDVTVGNIYISPSGEYLAIDLRPTAAATDKWGVRMGLFEIDIAAAAMVALVPESSPGQGDATYNDHLVQLLSWSPDSRYIAYNRARHLWLYDRYSGANIDVADVGSTGRTPTIWQN